MDVPKLHHARAPMLHMQGEAVHPRTLIFFDKIYLDVYEKYIHQSIKQLQ